MLLSCRVVCVFCEGFMQDSVFIVCVALCSSGVSFSDVCVACCVVLRVFWCVLFDYALLCCVVLFYVFGVLLCIACCVVFRGIVCPFV